MVWDTMHGHGYLQDIFSLDRVLWLYYTRKYGESVHMYSSFVDISEELYMYLKAC